MNLAPILATLYGWPMLILAFAIYSITRLICADSILDRQRNWFFDRFPHDGYTTKKRPNERRTTFIVTGDHYYVTKGTLLGKLVNCMWCAGFWVSLGVLAAFAAWPVATLFVLAPLAFRVIPGIFDSIVE